VAVPNRATPRGLGSVGSQPALGAWLRGVICTITRQGPVVGLAGPAPTHRRRLVTRLLRGLAAGLLALGLICGGPLAQALEDTEAATTPVVMIGVTGLTWNDVSPESTPQLWALANLEGAGLGNLLVRSHTAGSCPVDGWLALNAGQRAGATPGSPVSDLVGVPADCATPAEPVAGLIKAWPKYQAANSGTALGALDQWLAQMDLTGVAVGPGAAIALAGTNGRVAAYWPAPADLAQFGEAVQTALAQAADLVVIDAGSRSTGLEPAELDRRVGAALQLSPGPVIVASLADYHQPDMSILISRGFGPSQTDGLELIGSTATRRPGLSVVTELHRVLQAALVPAPVGPATPWRFSPAEADLGQTVVGLRQDATHAQAMRQVSQAAYTTVVVLAALGIVAGLLAANRRRPLPGWEALALLTATLPVASLVANLTPWWRCPYPYAAWLAVSLGLAAGLTVLVLVLRWAVPWKLLKSPMGAPGIVGLITAGVLVADPLVGQPFTWAAPMGTPVLNAVRLYGLGNPAFALLATGWLVATVLVAGPAWLKGQRQAAAVSSLVVGLAATVFVAAPFGAASFGGAITMAAAVLVLAMLAGDLKLTWRRLVTAGLIAAAAGALALVLDYLRGPDHWTHLGGFVDRLLTGQAWSVVATKAAVWLRLSAGVALMMALAYLAWRIARRRGFKLPGWTRIWQEAPMMRPIGLALLVLWVVGSLVNDSGLVVAGIGACLAGPLLAAALLRDNANRTG